MSSVHFLVVPRPDSGDSGAYFSDTDHSSRGGYSVLKRGIFCIREGGGNKKLMMILRKTKDL